MTHTDDPAAVRTDEPVAGSSDRAARARPALSDRRVTALAIGLALVPLLAAVIELVVDVGDDFVPWADHALMELRTRDVGRHRVLLGLYSRDGWSHPGPLLFYLLAVPYRLSGSAAIGLSIGALLINGASIAGMAVIARRRGGTPLLLCTLVASGLLVRALGADFMWDYWVCFVTTLPFGLLLFLTWSMACGERWALPVAAAVGTFLAQTHVGFVPVAIPLVLWGAGWLVWRARADAGPDDRPWWRSLAPAAGVTAVVFAVLWLPTVVEQYGGQASNISDIVEYFRETEEEPHTLAEGYRVTFGQFGLPPEWVAGVRPMNPFTGDTAFLEGAPPPVLLAPVALAAIAFWRWRRRDGLQLLGVVAAGVALSVVAVARTVGVVYEYRLRWTLLLPMVALVAAAWAGWTWVGRRWPGAPRRVLVPGALVALLVLAGVNTASAFLAEEPQAQYTALTRPLVEELADNVPTGEGDLVVRYPDYGSWWYASTVVSELERRGHPAKVDADSESIWNRQRVHRAGDPLAGVLTVAANDAYDRLAEDPPGRLVAYAGDVGPEERSRALRDTADEKAAIDDLVQAGELTPEDAAREVERLGGPGAAVGVWFDES